MAKRKISKKLVHYAVCSYEIDPLVTFPIFVNADCWQMKLSKAKKDLKRYRKQYSDAFIIKITEEPI